MSEALQVIVRGFQTQENGNVIVKQLEDAGFSIKEKIDGQSDSGGGIIETEITNTIQLDSAIDAASFKAISTDITVQIDRYEQVDA